VIERTLADVTPRVERPERSALHEVERTGDGLYACNAAGCGYLTDDLTAVAAHVVEMQWPR
jgi:hypothetical protein